MKIEHVIGMIVDDLERAEAKLEYASMELLGHKDDIATAFSGTLTAYDQIVHEMKEKLLVIASDLHKGFAGGPNAEEDPRVKELADKLRKITCGVCDKDALSCDDEACDRQAAEDREAMQAATA